MSARIVLTADQSPTIHNTSLNEHFHSLHGAVSESTYVFLHAGFEFYTEDGPATVFEVGFGTGLNAFLTCLSSYKNRRETIYHCIEKYPLQKTLTDDLSKFYLAATGLPDFFSMIHDAPWNEEVTIHEYFRINKCNGDFLSYNFPFQFRIIYYDAFSPGVQPELWTETVFRKVYDALEKNGILVTYSSKGTVKQALRNAGFLVKRISGPVGKRHILRAEKC